MVGDATVTKIAHRCSSLISLSLVGCKVSVCGLLCLGSPEHRCSKTLRDLHLSNTLRMVDITVGSMKGTRAMATINEEIDLRDIIFLSRGLGIPRDWCCHVYYR